MVVYRFANSWRVFGALFFCGCSCGPSSLEPPSSQKFAVHTYGTTINASPKLVSVVSDKLDSLGRPIRVSCTTCHSTREPKDFPRDASDLRAFHGGLVVNHGDLRCASCHVEQGGIEPKLRLADGRTLPTSDAIELCAQCHGPKYQDYIHGSHGGMNGYWDLSKGPRLRNHCVDCHDPHSPKFQPSRPVLEPIDRNVTGAAPHHE